MEWETSEPGSSSRLPECRSRLSRLPGSALMALQPSPSPGSTCRPVLRFPESLSAGAQAAASTAAVGSGRDLPPWPPPPCPALYALWPWLHPQAGPPAPLAFPIAGGGPPHQQRAGCPSSRGPVAAVRQLAAGGALRHRCSTGSAQGLADAICTTAEEMVCWRSPSQSACRPEGSSAFRELPPVKTAGGGPRAAL